MPSLPKSLVALLLLVIVPRASEAKNAGEYLTDAKDYALAPLHWTPEQWEWAAGATASVATAYAFDGRVRSHFADASTSPSGDPHSLRDAAPAIALTLGTLAYGFVRDDATVRSTGEDMVEAVALGALSSFAMKAALGRTRPDSTSSRSAWGSGGDSFPSGHVTGAFAAAQVFADSRPPGDWAWRALAYSLAGLTAYARVNDNMHWTSDVVAGAALGIATGRFVSNREGRTHRSPVTLWVQPLQRGAMLSFAIDPP